MSINPENFKNDTEQVRELKHGTFSVRFDWAEGNLDTGVKHQDIEEFARSLAGALLDNGAWNVHIYGPDGNQLPITDA